MPKFSNSSTVALREFDFYQSLHKAISRSAPLTAWSEADEKLDDSGVPM
jgi:hypothetical protein